MKNSTIITLVISGLVIALIGIGLDYQRRVESRERYDTWRLADHQRRLDEKRKSDAAMAAMNRSIEDFGKESADSLKKIEEARLASLRIAQDEAEAAAREKKRLELLRMRIAAEDALEKASAESDRALLGSDN
jgi:hypothetical protein